MTDRRADMRKDVVAQSKSDTNKPEKTVAVREKTGSMPNPVKGLTLSLYPMIKEH